MTIEDSASATTTTTTNEHPQVVTAEEEEQEQPEEEKEERSALRDNIERKGKNAYYFAHAKTANGPKWDGKIEPKLLTTSSSSVSSSASMSKLSLMAKSNITNYAFLDDGTKVKIYVNLPGVGDCEDDKITIDFTERSLCLMVKDYSIPSPLAIKKEQNEEEQPQEIDGEKKEENKGQLIVDTAPSPPPETTTVKEEIMEECSRKEDRCLTFAQLYGDIEKATFKKKPDKVIITLKKKKNDSKKKWNSIIA